MIDSYGNVISKTVVDEHLFSTEVIDRSKKTDYTLTKNNQYEEKNDMSLVVFACVNDGIVAVADKKSTSFVNGEPIKEKERIATKIFVSKNFILGTFGCNNVGCENIEDVITKIIKEHPDDNYKAFLERFRSYLNMKEESKTYNFIIGAKNKESGTYFAKGFLINCEDITWDKGYAESGTARTILKNSTKIDLFNFDFKGNLTINEVSFVLQKTIDLTIEVGDILLSYNPIGLGTDILVFSR